MSSLSEEGFCLVTGRAAEPGLLTHPRPEVARVPSHRARLGFAPILVSLCSIYCHCFSFFFRFPRRQFLQNAQRGVWKKGLWGNIPFELNKPKWLCSFLRAKVRCGCVEKWRNLRDDLLCHVLNKFRYFFNKKELKFSLNYIKHDYTFGFCWMKIPDSEKKQAIFNIIMLRCRKYFFPPIFPNHGINVFHFCILG